MGAGILALRVVPRFEYGPGITDKQTMHLSFGNLETGSFSVCP
jgi:hypothetical protein